MEFILSFLFIIGFIIYVKYQENKTSNYCNNCSVDWKKVNDDKTMNGLSNMEIDKNIRDGKYNKK